MNMGLWPVWGLYGETAYSPRNKDKISTGADDSGDMRGPVCATASLCFTFPAQTGQHSRPGSLGRTEEGQQRLTRNSDIVAANGFLSVPSMLCVDRPFPVGFELSSWSNIGNLMLWVEPPLPRYAVLWYVCNGSTTVVYLVCMQWQDSAVLLLVLVVRLFSFIRCTYSSILRYEYYSTAV